MKISTKFFVFAISLAGLTTSVNAQSTAFATTTATLVEPISITNSAPLSFGSIATGTAGTVVLAPDGNVTDLAGLSVPSNGISTSAASFNVTGAGTSGFTVSLPTSIILTSGIDELTVDTFQASNNIVGGVGTLAGGTSIITIGATLNVPANAVAGSYTNTSNDIATGLFVTVNYN